jgi:fructokinase
VKNANTVALIGHPLDKDLAAALGRPVRLANDANCFALSEAADGAGAGKEAGRVVFGVILGTGVGGGLVVGGHVLTGPNGVAASGAQPPALAQRRRAPRPRLLLRQGRLRGDVPVRAGMARDHRRRTGQDLTAPLIAERAGAGNPEALATLERYEERLARALAIVINILDPDAIVLGGGLSNITRFYEKVPALWGRYVFSDTVRTALVPARHGDSSGVRGAAWLWPV